MWYSNEITYDVRLFTKILTYWKIVYIDYLTKSLETLHVDTDERRCYTAIFRATCVATALLCCSCIMHEQRCYTAAMFLTSCKMGVTLCNASKIRCIVAAIVAKSRTWFYFVQRLLQQKCCETWWLRGMLHHAISRATCVATKLQDKLHEKLQCNTAFNLYPPHAKFQVILLNNLYTRFSNMLKFL